MTDYDATHEWEGAIALPDTPGSDHRLLINAYGRVLDRLRDRVVSVMVERPDPDHRLIRVGTVDGFLTRGNELRAIGAVDLALIEDVRPDVATAMRQGQRIPVGLKLWSCTTTRRLDDIEASILRGLAAAVLQHDLSLQAGQRPHLDEPDVATAASKVLCAVDDWELQSLLLDSPSPWPGIGIELDDFTGSLGVKTSKPPRQDQ